MFSQVSMERVLMNIEGVDYVELDNKENILIIYLETSQLEQAVFRQIEHILKQELEVQNWIIDSFNDILSIKYKIKNI